MHRRPAEGDNRASPVAHAPAQPGAPMLTTPQWHDANPQTFTMTQRGETTILFGGTTNLGDKLIESAMTALGYRAQALACPDTEALRYGKEFGNRGQCNPTYFTVGNLLKHLTHLRDDIGLTAEEIVDKYVFVTAGACGPCRFGMYTTEYRKALRDIGFEGFRVMTFQNSGSVSQSSKNAGLALTPKFFLTLLKAIIAADVLNALGYRIRPYETVSGSTNAAMKRCQSVVSEALRNGNSVIHALVRCRNVLKAVSVDRLQPKPKVSIIGEFWAMTTEGEGNYRLQQFLESEGAECEVQTITAWILYTFWQTQHDTRERIALRRQRRQEPGFESKKRLVFAGLSRWVLERTFSIFARAAGLEGFRLPNMDALARVSEKFYSTALRGGEGHMEVGKLIQTAESKKAHLVVSVKPFGCMPSSGVSDGIQALTSMRATDADFLPIETSGDGAVNVYSRLQMALFKARKRATSEFHEALTQSGLNREEAARRIAAKRGRSCALHHPRHVVASTAANAVMEVA